MPSIVRIIYRNRATAIYMETNRTNGSRSSVPNLISPPLPHSHGELGFAAAVPLRRHRRSPPPPRQARPPFPAASSSVPSRLLVVFPATSIPSPLVAGHRSPADRRRCPRLRQRPRHQIEADPPPPEPCKISSPPCTSPAPSPPQPRIADLAAAGNRWVPSRVTC